MRVAVAVLAVLFAALGVVLMIVASRRRPTRVRTEAPAVSEPSDFDRRQFLNRAMLGSLGVFAVAFGTGSIAFLWPEVREGSGSKIVVGKRGYLLEELDLHGEPIYNQDGRFYLVRYEGKRPDYYSEQGALAAGLMAIFQKCSHLGCRVPWCPSSGWFECPCHDARFNAAGEVMNPPAQAGMWHFPISINSRDEVVVDTARRIAQAPKGFDSYGTGPAGDLCVKG